MQPDVVPIICHRCQQHKRNWLAKFAAGVIDTGGKFAAGVVDTGGNLTGVIDTGVVVIGGAS
jgi:hypothetical protein